MPKFSPTAEVGTQHPRRVQAPQSHSYTSGRDDMCEKLMRNSRTALPCNIIAQLILLGLNAVQVVGSNPASVIVIKVVAMAKQNVHKNECRFSLSFLPT